MILPGRHADPTGLRDSAPAIQRYFDRAAGVPRWRAELRFCRLWLRAAWRDRSRRPPGP